MDTGSPHNPFSTHLMEPQRGGYIFPPGQSLEEVVSALEAMGWRGELSGNHGAGKSTLLADICAHLESIGLTTVWWQSSDRRRLPPRSWLRDIRRADVIAYDGAERLLPGLLLFLRIFTRLLGRGFIVTTHWRHGYGAYIPVKPSARSLAQKCGAAGLAGYTADEWFKKIDDGLARHHGDSRQVLFDLYVDYENVARNGATTSDSSELINLTTGAEDITAADRPI